MRYHAFDQVLFAQPFQFTVNLGHEVSDFFLVYLHLFQFVDHFDKLFLADLLACRHLSGDELLADNAFDFAQLAFFSQVDDGDGSTCLSCTSGTSAAVRIAFRIIRQTVVDYMRQIVYVEPACGNIRSYEQLQVADAELLHHCITLGL